MKRSVRGTDVTEIFGIALMNATLNGKEKLINVLLFSEAKISKVKKEMVLRLINGELSWTQ